MDYVWELLGPWIATIGGASGVGLIIYTTVRALLDKILKKNKAVLTDTFSSDVLSQKVAERIAGKTLNIDVTAVTEKALKKLSKQLDDKIQKVENATNSYKHILALIAKGISKYKALTDEEVAEITTAIKEIESDYIPPEKDEPMTVVLQPITLAETEEVEEEPTAGVNFEGLE